MIVTIVTFNRRGFMPVEGSTSNELFTHSSTIPSIQERKNQLNKSIVAQNKTSVNYWPAGCN
jgi:hypothetical protein